MKYGTYLYNREGQLVYSFISSGKRNILKTVIFTPTEYEDIVNLGFGDLMPDGTVDDVTQSNNGDMAIVLATVIEIVRTFITEHPRNTIFFKGSTPQRTRFYQRIIKNYYKEFASEFIIIALIQERGGYQALLFNENVTANIFAFLVKKIV